MVTCAVFSDWHRPAVNINPHIPRVWASEAFARDCALIGELCHKSKANDCYCPYKVELKFYEFYELKFVTISQPDI